MKHKDDEVQMLQNFIDSEGGLQQSKINELRDEIEEQKQTILKLQRQIVLVQKKNDDYEQTILNLDGKLQKKTYEKTEMKMKIKEFRDKTDFLSEKVKMHEDDRMEQKKAVAAAKRSSAAAAAP